MTDDHSEISDERGGDIPAVRFVRLGVASEPTPPMRMRVFEKNQDR